MPTAVDEDALEFHQRVLEKPRPRGTLAAQREGSQIKCGVHVEHS